MNLDEKKFLFSLTSNWNLAFSLIMNISHILTLTVSVSPKEVTDTLKSHYRVTDISKYHLYLLLL